MVPHRGTNWAAPWLTSQIGRDAVLSRSYGRGCLPRFPVTYKPPVLNLILGSPLDPNSRISILIIPIRLTDASKTHRNIYQDGFHLCAWGKWNIILETKSGDPRYPLLIQNFFPDLEAVRVRSQRSEIRRRIHRGFGNDRDSNNPRWSNIHLMGVVR